MKSVKGPKLPFSSLTQAANSGDLPLMDLQARSHGNVNDFFKKVKGQCLETHASFNT